MQMESNITSTHKNESRMNEAYKRSLLINTELRKDQRKFERKKVIGGIVIDKVRINIKTKKKRCRMEYWKCRK